MWIQSACGNVRRSKMHKSPTANRIEELFSALVAEEKISIIGESKPRLRAKL